jgi:putative thiamine transport system permease protein
LRLLYADCGYFFFQNRLKISLKQPNKHCPNTNPAVSAKTIPAMRPHLPTAAILLTLLGLPLGWATLAAVLAGLDATAWQALAHDPQTAKALWLSMWTGLASTLLATACAAWLLSRSFATPVWQRLLRGLGPMLALPHLAFAIGLMALVAPSGWLLRLLSPWATGFDSPPAWVTTQDPWGLGLIAVLVFKEVPFLLWAAASQLNRADVADTFTRELLLARSMGYSHTRAWWRVVWPQLWPRLRWPLLAVLAYGLTVVDVALVIGPSSPPTLAALAWRWLQDADLARNAQGAAAAWALAGMLALLSALLWQVPRLHLFRQRWASGERGRSQSGVQSAAHRSGWGLFMGAFVGTYAAVMLALLVGSVSGVWAFPAVVPQTFTTRAWVSVWGSWGTVGTTLGLALASASAAMVWSVAWLENAPPRWDAFLRRAIYVPLVLPSVLWVIGVHALSLHWSIDATWPGVWLAHTLITIPYVLIALSPAYLGFDVRYWHISASLGKSHWSFLWLVKWPLLKGALASAFAVGFAVSVAQYLPTMFIGAGRFATVTTEAVALASGAQRSLTSAYAGLQWLLPVLVFGLAAWAGRARRFAPQH